MEDDKRAGQLRFGLFCQYLQDKPGLRLGRNGLLACLIFIQNRNNQHPAQCAGDIDGMENISLIADRGSIASTGDRCVLCC